jgi:hypothetical protein
LERRRERETYSGLRRGDLDSEGENERSFFEKLPPPRFEART